jgi:hypothetical protein
MLRRPHPRGAHSCPQDRRRRSGCCSSGDLGRRRHEQDHDDHRRFLEARQISWRQRTVLDCGRQAAAIHDRRGQRVLRLRHDPSGICGGRGDPVPVGEADLPSAVVATFCHRVTVPYRPFLHHLCGGDSRPVARQIEHVTKTASPRAPSAAASQASHRWTRCGGGAIQAQAAVSWLTDSDDTLTWLADGSRIM